VLGAILLYGFASLQPEPPPKSADGAQAPDYTIRSQPASLVEENEWRRLAQGTKACCNESPGGGLFMTNPEERRKHVRYRIQFPVRVQTVPREAYTRDISADGAYLLTHENGLEPGSKLEWEMDFSPRFAGVKTVRVRCRGKIVRVEPLVEQGKIGVAVTIKSYQFLRDE
jgi:PilZ domain-containing protein